MFVFSGAYVIMLLIFHFISIIVWYDIKYHILGAEQECIFRSLKWVPPSTRKSNWMDSIICGHNCICDSRKPHFHSQLRLYITNADHWLLSPRQFIHQRHFNGLIMYSFHIEFRTIRNILV